jgi:prophage regulatory protein
MSKVILRLPQVKTVTGLSRSSIYNYVSMSSFPSPVRLGPRSVGWLESEIDAWVSDRVAKSRTSRPTVRNGASEPPRESEPPRDSDPHGKVPRSGYRHGDARNRGRVVSRR